MNCLYRYDIPPMQEFFKKLNCYKKRNFEDMSESLIEQLPKIVAEGKKEVERILERISSPHKRTSLAAYYPQNTRKETNGI